MTLPHFLVATKRPAEAPGTSGEIVFASVPPEITPNPAATGEELTVSDGTWNAGGVDHAYQWYVDGVAQDGETANTFTPDGLAPGDVTADVTNTGDLGSATDTAPPPAITPAPVGTPVTDFSADVQAGAAPLTVTFTDESTNTPTTWLWRKKPANGGWTDFAGTPTAQNPVEDFAAGTWKVRLKATNAFGSDVETKSGFIVVTP